jgi:hypothetical protein
MFLREMSYYDQNRNGKGCYLDLLSFSCDVEASFLQLVK